MEGNHKHAAEIGMQTWEHPAIVAAAPVGMPAAAAPPLATTKAVNAAAPILLQAIMQVV
jgi:hypothetical protein